MYVSFFSNHFILKYVYIGSKKCNLEKQTLLFNNLTSKKTIFREYCKCLNYSNWNNDLIKYKNEHNGCSWAGYNKITSLHKEFCFLYADRL